MLGEPALVAAHHRRDAQREALLAEQRVAAVARAEAPDLARFGKVDDVLVSTDCTATARRCAPARSGAPTECTHGTNAPSVPSTSYTARPIRVMMRMLTTTYGLSVISTPMCAIGLPSGPIENGTTYIVRPRMQPSKSPSQRRAHLRGRHPVVRRPRVFLALAADERAVLDARDVGRVRAREEAVRAAAADRADAASRGDHLVAQPLVFGIAAVAPDDPRRAESDPRSAHPVEQARGCARMPARRATQTAPPAIRYCSSDAL